ncbi:MAG: hypothetical protein KF821_06785 [Anaerolineales bacterium]|nr:hypothetical protein [Anaerolineales bacterium]MBX3005518.1 hypothetical protein [Anaerolineales bacterium]MCW5887841.1 hypothetical protein [Anaerolineales bacterium]
MRTFAAMLAILSGLGFGLPAAYGSWYFARYGFAWRLMGFPTHETSRFFEQFGLFTSWPLIAGFVLVCAVEVACGWLLWANKPAGRWLAFALLPFELAYWLGFNLPFGPLGGLLRTLALLSKSATTEPASHRA